MKIQQMFNEAENRISALTRILVSRVDPADIHVELKEPFKAINYRELIAWRTEELSRTSLEMYKQDNLASAITLTRAALECVAALQYLSKLMQDGYDASFDEKVMRLLMGQKIKGLEVDVEAVNVLTFIDKFETIMPNIRKVYEYLSEYSHPNWSGTMYLYSVINHKEVWVDLGKDADRYEGLKLQGLHALNAILVLFQVIYEDIDKSLPNFIKQCVTANNKGK